MSIFKRLFNLGKAEANSVIDKLEDPIKLTEQGIRDLKKDMDEALKALAEVKAMAIRARNESVTYDNKAKDYEKKAILLLQKAERGEMEASEAERLATESLSRKNENDTLFQQSKTNQTNFENSVKQLDGKVKQLRTNVSKFENELKTLKARVKVSKATKQINKQMAQIDSSGTVSMLERMKDKVAQEEALAESYGEIANESKSLDDEIDGALGGESNAQASNDLAALKAKLKM